MTIMEDPPHAVPDFEELYDRAPVGYLTSTKEGMTLAVNETLLSWSGREREEFQHCPWWELLLTQAGQTFFASHVDPMLRLQGHVKEVSADLVRADHSRLPVLLFIECKGKGTERPIYRVTVVEVADRRRYECQLLDARRFAEEASQALRELTADLEQRVESRTAALKAAYEELDAFSYAVQHDLRAPLAALHGCVTVLQETYEDDVSPEAMTWLVKIAQSAQQMNAMIDGLFRLSLDARAELRCEPFDVTACAEALLGEFAKADPGRVVRWSVAPELRIWADPHLMVSALRNLLGNAWKYTARVPQTRIEVSLQHDAGRDWIAVRDNGVGFDPAQAQWLFKPFRRLHNAGDFPGSGIGLSTVQRIVRRHGGAIEATAVPGEGATFRFWVPGR